MCVPVCPYGYFGDISNLRTCTPTCSVLTEFGNPLNRLCVVQTSCPAPYLFADNYTRQCVTRCPESQNTFGDISTNACVADCPWNTTSNYYTYRDPSTQSCVTACPSNPSYYRYNGTIAICTSGCPAPYFAV